MLSQKELNVKLCSYPCQNQQKSFINAILLENKLLTIEELTIAKQRSRDILSFSFTHLPHKR